MSNSGGYSIKKRELLIVPIEKSEEPKFLNNICVIWID
jgi:hypothetical protein